MIAIVFAMEFEAKAFPKNCKDLAVESWSLKSTGIDALSRFSKKAKKNTPYLVVNTGLAGGLKPELRTGDIIIDKNSFLFTDEEYIKNNLVSHNSALSLFDHSKPNGRRVMMGRCHTVDRLLAGSEEKFRLGVDTDADCCDMEAEHLRNACLQLGVPFLAIKAISDPVGFTIRIPQSVLINPLTKKPDPFQLFAHLASRPWNFPGFVKMARQAFEARAQLAGVLAELLPELVKLKQ